MSTKDPNEVNHQKPETSDDDLVNPDDDPTTLESTAETEGEQVEEGDQQHDQKSRMEQDHELSNRKSTYLERSIFLVDIHPVEELVKKYTSPPENHFEKTGFYLAIDPEAVPIEKAKKRLSQLLIDQEEEVKRAIASVDEHIKHQKAEIALALIKLEKQIEEEEEKLKDSYQHLPKFEQEVEAVQGEIANLKKELKEVLVAIGSQGDDIIEKRIQALRRELHELATTYEEITTRKQQVNELEFNANREVFAERATRYQELYDKAKERLTQLQGKLKRVPGLTDQSHQFLFWAGVGAAGGAGWFFSVYIVNKELFSSDFLSFFFTRLFSVSSGFGQMDPIGLILSMVLTLIVILGVTTFLSWLGQKLLQKNLSREDEKGNNKRRKKRKNTDGDGTEPAELEAYLALTPDRGDKNLYRDQIHAGSSFTSWLKALPVVFLLGALFILLSVSGTSTKDVSQLMSSLSGHFIGTSIAFGVAGLVYIYIRSVIDPRLETETTDEQDEANKILKKNSELIGVIIAFVLAMVGMIIWPDEAFVAVFGFIAIALMTGFVMGYAVYYRGLMAGDRELKNEMLHLSFAIDNCRRPRPLYIMGAEGQQFKYNYLVLMQQMYTLSQIRNQQAAEVLAGGEIASRIKLAEKVPGLGKKFLKNVLQSLLGTRAEKEEVGDSDALELAGLRNSYYHKDGLLHRELSLELKRKKAELAEVEANLKACLTGQSHSQTEYRWQIEKYTRDKDRLIEARERLERLLIDAVTSLNIEKDRRNIALRDGFDLGLWHRANDIEPTPKYKFEDISTLNVN